MAVIITYILKCITECMSNVPFPPSSQIVQIPLIVSSFLSSFFYLVFFLLYCLLSCLRCYTETCTTYQKCIYSPQGPVLIWWASHYIAWIDGRLIHIYYCSMLFKSRLLTYIFVDKISVDHTENNWL